MDGGGDEPDRPRRQTGGRARAAARGSDLDHTPRADAADPGMDEPALRSVRRAVCGYFPLSGEVLWWDHPRHPRDADPDEELAAMFARLRAALAAWAEAAERLV
jgi:hypothetical protein